MGIFWNGRDFEQLHTVSISKINSLRHNARCNGIGNFFLCNWEFFIDLFILQILCYNIKIDVRGILTYCGAMSMPGASQGGITIQALGSRAGGRDAGPAKGHGCIPRPAAPSPEYWGAAAA